MPRRSGQTMTIMFITSGWPTNRGVINAAYREFTENGWTEHRNEKPGSAVSTEPTLTSKRSGGRQRRTRA